MTYKNIQGIYVVDAGNRGVWAWVGGAAGGAGGSAARGALAAARGLARARRYCGPVSCCAGGREPLEFAALFHRWRWCDARRDVRLRAARSATTKLDAVSLATNAWLAAEVISFLMERMALFHLNRIHKECCALYTGAGSRRRVWFAAHVARAARGGAGGGRGGAGRGGAAAARRLLRPGLLHRALHVPRAHWRTICTLLLDGMC